MGIAERAWAWARDRAALTCSPPLNICSKASTKPSKSSSALRSGVTPDSLHSCSNVDDELVRSTSSVLIVFLNADESGDGGGDEAAAERRRAAQRWWKETGRGRAGTAGAAMWMGSGRGRVKAAAARCIADSSRCRLVVWRCLQDATWLHARFGRKLPSNLASEPPCRRRRRNATRCARSRSCHPPRLGAGARATPSHPCSLAQVSISLLRAGDGINYPQDAQSVSVHYDAFLPNGAQWDSSRKRGRPLRFRVGVGQVVAGLELGVREMSIGEHVRLRVPHELAYGERGFPGLVPPCTDIEFDIELIDIV